MENRKNFLLGLAIVLFCIICLGIASCIHDSNQSAGADTSNIRGTVQQLHEDSNGIRDALGNAQVELTGGQQALEAAGTTARELQESNTASAGLIDDSERLLRELKQQLEDLGSASGRDGAQAGRERKAE